MTPEERKTYNKEYYINNQEYFKEYYINNQDKIKEQSKEYSKEYLQTEAGKKSKRITNWKQTGVKSADYNALYEYYINCKYCENCGVEFVDGDLGSNKKCLDHSHKTGLFRNILCCGCNNRRGENNTLLL
jgi:hypothetical protein